MGVPDAVSACLAFLLAFVPAPVQNQSSADGAIIRGPVSEHAVALVFTGHEFAEGGTTILDVLARRQARASFFLTGDFLRRQEFAPFVSRLLREGHYLGPHSDKHLLYCDWTAKKTLVTRDEFLHDLVANLAEIERAGARPAPRLFLPAYEWCNREVVGWAAERGITTVNYTPGTLSHADYTEDGDRNHRSSDQILESIRRHESTAPNGLNGFLLLMHVGAGPGRTDKLAARLDEIVGPLAAKGYRFVRVDDLLK